VQVLRSIDDDQHFAFPSSRFAILGEEVEKQRGLAGESPLAWLSPREKRTVAFGPPAWISLNEASLQL
jgi:hypothetical protein